MIGRDDRATHCLRLDDDAAEPLGSVRGGDDDVGEHQRRRHVVAILDELKNLAEAARVDRALELAAKGRAPLVRTDEEAEQVAPAERGDRGDEVELPLPACQSPGQHDDRPVVGQTPFLGELDQPLGGDALGIEAGEVDAAVDDAQPFRRQPIDGGGVLGDEMRDRDHALAAPHHRIVPAAQTRAVAIGVVKGGDEMPAGALRRDPGAPGRRAAARVNDVDAVLLDQRGEPGGIAAHDERVLRCQRQGEVDAAVAGQLVHHLAARGGDVGTPAGGGERGGNVDGAALDAAADQARQHLEHARGAALSRHCRDA